MFRPGLSLCVVLGFASVANAGAVLELTMSDMGTLDGTTPAPNVCCWTDLPTPVQVFPGDRFMVHAYMTTDMAVTETRLLSVDPSGPATTVPMSWLGVDADTVNQPIDGVPNFWFDYTQASSYSGRFPAQGIVDIPPIPFPLSTTGFYTDFSNVEGEPIATTWVVGPIPDEYFEFIAGVPLHIGAMVVTVPFDAVLGPYALDLLNVSAPDSNSGARLIFGFQYETDWHVLNGMMSYAEGAGPAQFTVIPEPATLLLLGLGGVAALRRRR